MRSTRGTGVKGHDLDCSDTSAVSSEVNSNLQQELSSVLRKMRNRQGPCIDINNLDRAKSGRSVTYTGGVQLGRGFGAPKGDAVDVVKDKDDTRLSCHSPPSPGELTVASGVIAPEQDTPVHKDSRLGLELSRCEVDDSHRSEMRRLDESARWNRCKEPGLKVSETLMRDLKHSDSSEEKQTTENEAFLEGDRSDEIGSKPRKKTGFGSCVNSSGSSEWDADKLEGAFRGRSLCQSEQGKSECVRAPSGEGSAKKVRPSATQPGLPLSTQVVVGLTKSSDVIGPHPRASQVLDPSRSPQVTGSFRVSPENKPTESSQVQRTFRASKGLSGSPILQQENGSAKPHQPNRSAIAQGPSGSSQSRGPNRSATAQGPSGSSQSRGPNRSAIAQGPSGSSQSRGPNRSATAQGPSGSSQSRGPNRSATAQGPSGSSQSRGPNRPAAQGPGRSSQSRGPGWLSQVKTTWESPIVDVEDVYSLSLSDTVPNEVTRICENELDRVSCDGSSITHNSHRSSRSDLDQSHALSYGDSATTEDYMYLWDGATHLPPGHRTRFMSFSIGGATCCTGDDAVYDPRHIPQCSWRSGRAHRAQRACDTGGYVRSVKSDWADLIGMEEVVLRSFSGVSRSVSAGTCTERRGELLRSRNELRKSSSEPVNVTRQLSEMVCSDGTKNKTATRHGTNSPSQSRAARSSPEQKTTTRSLRNNSEQVRRLRSSLEQMSYRGSERTKVEQRKVHPPRRQTRCSLIGVGPGPSSWRPVNGDSVITRPVIMPYGDHECHQDGSWHPDTSRHRVTAPELTSLPRLDTKNRYHTTDRSRVRGHRSVVHPYPSVVATTPRDGRISSIGVASVSCSDIQTYRKNPVHHGRRPDSVETCRNGSAILERPLQRRHRKNARKNRRKLAVDTSFSDDTTDFHNTGAATYVNVAEFCGVGDDFEDSLIKYVHVNDLSLLNDDIQRRYRMHLGGAIGIQSVAPPSAGLLHRFTCCFCCHRHSSALELDGMGPSKQNIPTVLVQSSFQGLNVSHCSCYFIKYFCLIY